MTRTPDPGIAGIALSSNVLRLWSRGRKQQAANELMAAKPDEVRRASARLAEFAYQVVLQACQGDKALAIQFIHISLEQADPTDLADIILSEQED